MDIRTDKVFAPDGRELMNDEYVKEINRKRFGWKKREPKPYIPPEDEAEPASPNEKAQTP